MPATPPTKPVSMPSSWATPATAAPACTASWAEPQPASVPRHSRAAEAVMNTRLRITSRS